MANGKKSFVLYCDLIHTLEHLTDEQAGKLFKHVAQYVNDKDPETNDAIVKIAFEPIKQQLKRDLSRWEGYIEKQSLNGKKGGRPKTQAKAKKPKPLLENPTKAKKADSVTVSVSVSDSVIKEDSGAAFAKREEEFYQRLVPFVGEYPKQMVRDFFDFWSEWDDKKKFMRWEINKKKGGVFDVARRLATWKRKEDTPIGKKPETTTYKPGPKLGE